MYNAHRARGLLIIGVPCNLFAAEEPWPEQQIKEFVSSSYGVDFPMLGKVDVIGDNICPLYRLLKEKLPDSEVGWNFAKYLVDKDGNVVKFFHHEVNPGELMPDIEVLLS